MHEHASDPQQVQDSLQKSVAKALERKRRLGQYAVVWRDGRAVRLEPDKSGWRVQEIDEPEASSRGHHDTMNTCIQSSVAMSTSIRLAPDTEKRLNELAARTGRTKAFYLRHAVEEYLDDMEEFYLAEKELKMIREGRARTYSMDEVKRELGLED